MKKDFYVRRSEFNEISSPAMVKQVNCGNITEFTTIQKMPPVIPVKKISKENYVFLPTGEVKEYDLSDNKSEVDTKNIRNSLVNLRRLINTNCVDSNKIRWLTLTYKENMTDIKKLYIDFRDFWKRFKYYSKKNSFEIPEYINVVEPQNRGAWHCHIIFIYQCKAPFIDNNSVIAKLWGHGFTKIKSVQDVDNIGAYFSAYLSDMPLDDLKNVSGIPLNKIVEKNIIEDNGKKIGKKFVKGARLSLYPAGMNIYRCSRGIKKPKISDISGFSDDEIKKIKASSGKLTFKCSSVVTSVDSSDAINVINKEYYNRKNSYCQHSQKFLEFEKEIFGKK